MYFLDCLYLGLLGVGTSLFPPIYVSKCLMYFKALINEVNTSQSQEELKLRGNFNDLELLSRSICRNSTIVFIVHSNRVLCLNTDKCIQNVKSSRW